MMSKMSKEDIFKEFDIEIKKDLKLSKKQKIKKKYLRIELLIYKHMPKQRVSIQTSIDI